MSLLQYTITNDSAVSKTFTYYSASAFHNINVSGFGTVTFSADDTIPPQQANTGLTETQFLSSSLIPSEGVAWLWNNGNKVKHIKISNLSANGNDISSFIQDSSWVDFKFSEAINSTGSYVHPSAPTDAQLERYILGNVNQYSSYNSLVVDTASPETSFAVASLNSSELDFRFTASGDFIWYATASGDILEPVLQTGYSASLPQGFFPKNLGSGDNEFPNEQFFRGWYDSSFYIGNSFVDSSGLLNDALKFFNTGSKEIDRSKNATYSPSVIPWFVDSSLTTSSITSSSFSEYTSQSQTASLGLTFVDGAGDLVYYYKEDTNEILYDGDPSSTKSSILFNPKLNAKLVELNNSQSYTTLEGFNIPVSNDNELWVYRGTQPIGTGNTNAWQYNKFIHRPYKIYILTTGSGGNSNEISDIFVTYSSSLASSRNDGVYSYSLSTPQNLELNLYVNLTGSTPDVLDPAIYGTSSYGTGSYGGSGVIPSISTWDTASLRIYVDGFQVKEEEYTGLDVSSIRTISASFSYTPVIGNDIKVSLFVTGSDINQGAVNSSLLVVDYTMSISASEGSSEISLTPTYFDKQVKVIDDCNPLVNNVVNSRLNPYLQDVDYSVNALDPINFDQLITFSATKAAVPESNYTQLGSILSKYVGSSTTRDNINEYSEAGETDPVNKKVYSTSLPSPELIAKGKGPSLGKIPNVESRNAYIGYFNKIIDPYPLLNGKTAYYVKYLIDDQGNVLEPSLSDINYSILTNTFKLSDYDSKPTRTNISIQNIESTKELSKLTNNFPSVFKVGQYPVPILYTQNSSDNYTTNIFLSGSTFYGTLGIDVPFTNFGANIFATQSQFPTAQGGGLVSEDLSLTPSVLDFQDIDIDLFDPSTGIYATGSVDGSVFFPLDPNASGSNANTAGASLSDPYVVNGSFEFFTSAIPARYARLRGDATSDAIWGDYVNRAPIGIYDPYAYLDAGLKPIEVKLYPFIKNNIDNPDELSDYTASLANFEIKSVNLDIYLDAGTNNEEKLPTLTIQQNPLGYSSQWEIDNVSKTITFLPESLYIEKLVIQNIVNIQNEYDAQARLAARQYLFGTWYRDPSGNVDGWGGRSVVYKWSINFDFTQPKQTTGLYLKTEGQMLFVDGRAVDRSDIYNVTYPTSLGETLPRWARTFTPDAGTFDTKPKIKYTITSPLAGADYNKNGASAPYWRRLPSGSGLTNDVLYMSSSILNQAYAILDENGNPTNGQYYVQAKLDYNPGPNPDFPLTREPNFIEFDPITDPWSLEVGDEIRFENNENYTYKILSITEPNNPRSEEVSDKLQVKVAPPFTDTNGKTVEPSNFDFFVVRRYKENKNFVILNQQKPYGFPVSQSSSPGVILPEHRIDQFRKDPDIVLQNLIERSII